MSSKNPRNRCPRQTFTPSYLRGFLPRGPAQRGSADLNTAWQTAPPASIANGDLVLNRDTSTVSGGRLTHGSQGMVQFANGQTTGPFSLLAVVQRQTGGL